MEVFDGLRKASIDNRSQLYKDLASGPFFGFNRPGAKSSAGLVDNFWAQGMQGSHKSTFDSIKAFSESNFVEDLKRVNVPTLVIHGADDQIVPIETAGRATVKLVKGARLIEYALAMVVGTRPDGGATFQSLTRSNGPVNGSSIRSNWTPIWNASVQPALSYGGVGGPPGTGKTFG